MQTEHHKTNKKDHPFDKSDSSFSSTKDNEQFLSGKDHAYTFFALTIESLDELGLKPKKNPMFLGLGVGSAIAEQALAKKFHAKKVFLVDKDPVVKVERAIRNRTTVIKDGIFNYLNRNQKNKFDIVSVIGIEYVLSEPGRSEELLRLLSLVMTNNGIVIISPMTHKLHFRIKEYGFEQIYKDYSTRILLFNKK